MRVLLLVGLVVVATGWQLSAGQFYNEWVTARFNDIPTQGGPTFDPDNDGESNAVEFAFGTDPRGAGGISASISPGFGTPSGTNGLFTVEILEREGHRPGTQIDLLLTTNFTNWFRPWWLRVTINSQPSDPLGSVREAFITRLNGTNKWFVRASVCVFEPGAETAKYYVATNGKDTNSGTSLAQPFLTLSNAVRVANPGDLIYMRGGTYYWTNRVRLTRSGTAAQPIRVRAYPGETPVLDFSAQSFASTNKGLDISGSWWWVSGLEVVGAGQVGINLTGHSNIIERCIAHHCRDSGIAVSQPASSNLILNCDSYRNFDFDAGTNSTHGENADGFAAKFGIGSGNVFRGCRSWENADDGWDLWQATNTVVIENCWTWRNGTNFMNDPLYAGDGNGFKIGGNYYSGAHILRNCISFLNLQTGFDQNNNIAGQTVDHCTAWANSGKNFNLNHGTNTTPHLVRNNLSVAGGSVDSFRSGTLLTNNSWQVVSPAVTASDWLSIDATQALSSRRDDGGLPETMFLRPVPGGRLVNKGVNTGGPFVGIAPDLGAFESAEW